MTERSRQEATTKRGARARASSRSSAISPLAEVSCLQGVGPQTAARLQEAGIDHVRALACLTPVSYRRRRRVRDLSDARDGDEIELIAELRRFQQRRFRGRYRAQAELVVLGDAGEPSQSLTARWFHPVAGLSTRARAGARVLVAGRVTRARGGRGKPTLHHPRLQVHERGDPLPDAARVELKYPTIEGLGDARIRKLCRAALAVLDTCPHEQIVELLPSSVRARQELPPLRAALRSLHEPPAELSEQELAALASGTSPGHRRLLFESHFFLQLELLQRRARWRQRAPTAHLLAGEFDGVARERLRAAVPFEPTRAQWRAIAEIEEDMAAGAPMLRLLQGDVGSGKTLVAFAAGLAVVEAGAQVALMVPTELLATQHLRTLGPWCARAGVRLARLTGATTTRERADVLSALARGDVDMVIGTHALLVEEVRFARLGLVVVDEQHRFGVEQRALLRHKGGAPHLLVMTATPIPRSLALTSFGELEISALDERPPGRRSPETRLFTDSPSGPGRGLAAARDALVRLVEAGLQAYVVCPLVSASEAVAATDVEETASRLRARLPGKRVEVVHGRVDPQTRATVMEQLRAGVVDVVVATTVIEVGVDVPEVRVILVEHAERFGLAQLHQLRGRVGRGEASSWCLLHTASAAGSLARARLEVLEATDDGFVVAERDLELRGPGEVFGTRQSGALGIDLHAGFIGAGVQTIVAARDAARELLAQDPGLEGHPEVAAELARRGQNRVVYAAEAG